MRIGGASDPVYDEYTAALGDEMKGMAAEFKALDLANQQRAGGELVAKGTFVKASPRERWYSNVALLNNKKGDWYARCLCIFRALDRDGEWKGYAYVRYYERAGSCKLTGCTQLHKKVEKVFTEFVETVNGVHFSRDRNTLILTIHEAHRITDEVARPVSEHGFSVQHLTNTRVVNIRGSVPEGGLPHLQGVEDALKAHYRVMLMKRAIAAKRFQFDYAASIADVDYGLMLEWLGESWTRVRAATMQRSWWRAGCVPPSWPPLMAYLNDTSATGMFEPLIATCVELQLLIEKFKIRPACYMTAAEFVNCDAGLCVEQGFVATPAASASDDSSDEMSLPDGPLLRDERSRRRVIRNVTNAYVERADELGIPPALVPAEVGASNQEVISRLGRTPVKRARAGLRTEDMAGPSERKDEDDDPWQRGCWRSALKHGALTRGAMAPHQRYSSLPLPSVLPVSTPSPILTVCFFASHFLCAVLQPAQKSAAQRSRGPHPGILQHAHLSRLPWVGTAALGSAKLDSSIGQSSIGQSSMGQSSIGQSSIGQSSIVSCQFSTPVHLPWPACPRRSDLSENQLSGAIPPGIGALTALRELGLSDNQLSGDIPPAIGALTSLSYLLLYNNQLSGAIPPAIGALTDLWYL
ncbi:unnamed protein product [Closterium sp. NIES-64]|nr:unnamed protein product [Closterium sp. NIES-64]